MTNYDVVKKLIGQIKPVGNTEIDNQRFENLVETIELVDLLLFEIESIASNSKAPEFSIKRAGTLAAEYLLALKNRI